MPEVQKCTTTSCITMLGVAQTTVGIRIHAGYAGPFLDNISHKN